MQAGLRCCMAERGKFRSIEYGLERADFSGLRFGTITPTDIDAFVEFEGRAFIFIETKHGAVEMPRGQQLAIERACEKIQAGGAQALALVVHKQGDTAGPTYEIGRLPVVLVWRPGGWRPPTRQITAREAIENFASGVLGRPIVAATEAAVAGTEQCDDWLLAHAAHRAILK